MFDSTNYRDILNHIFFEKSKKNTQYSRRAFARDLGLAPSTLSEVLAHKKRLSLEKAESICGLLNFNKEEKDFFLDLVTFSDSKNESQKKIAQIRLDKYRKAKFKKVDEDIIKLMSSWYGFAILELIHIKTFKPDIHWISAALRVSEDKISKMVDILIRLNLLKIDSGKWIDNQEFLETTDGVSSNVVKKLNRQLLNLAGSAIEEQPIEKRNASSIVMSISRDDLGKAHRMITEFRKKLNLELEKNKSKDRVYCLSTQFYDLSWGLENDL